MIMAYIICLTADTSKSVVDPRLSVVKLRSFKWKNRYLTGHSDSSVDGIVSLFIVIRTAHVTILR